MKKVVYLITLMFTVVLMSTSCEKPAEDTPDPKVKTLEQTYPEWKNLTWVSTDGKDASVLPAVYPRISIKIVGDSITMTQLVKFHQITEIVPYMGFYDEIIITGNTVKFGQKNDWGEAEGTFTKTSTHITLTTYGNITESHVYVLKIN